MLKPFCFFNNFPWNFLSLFSFLANIYNYWFSCFYRLLKNYK
ncbi:hypothetical protein BVAVS116_K0027 (plasmid) [Borreliella valaisiana VS116]|uniref:Uncharacterized protein n=1 Tax=Borreliella valaisiana VS116 TaxID=445987 RepID=C0R8M0_BORVA|nr:hypothetical protein BVAVS116_K0027 [Borreliella valaisiana VS116]